MRVLAYGKRENWNRMFEYNTPQGLPAWFCENMKPPKRQRDLLLFRQGVSVINGLQESFRID
jgi:hypothetical protein